MSRNFELLRRVQKGSDPVDPFAAPIDASGFATRFEGRGSGEDQSGGTDWLRAFNTLKRHWRWSVGFTLFVVLAAVAISVFTKPVYESTARVQVDPPGAEVFSMQGNNAGANSAEYLETQAKNLESDQLAIDVVRQLRLDQNPEFVGDDSSKGRDGSNSAPAGMTEAENRAFNALKKRLTVSRGTGSRLIAVTVGTHDPVVSATVANTLVKHFIERDYKMRHDAILQSSEWLSRQLDDIKARMEASNDTLAEFQKKSGIAAVDDTQNTFSGQMTELSRQLMQAQADRIQLQSYLNRFGGSTDSLPQISENPVVQQLTHKLAEVRADLAQTLAVYGRNHPNAKKLQNMSDELQSQLNNQRAAILQDLKTSYSAAKAREGLMQAQLKGTTRELGLIAQHNALKKEAEANTQLYNALFAKIKEASIASESKSSNIRVVDAARVMDEPARPRKTTNIAFGLLLGMIGGVVLAFIREGLETTIRTPEDIKKCIGTSSVSVMPVIGAGDEVTLGKRGLNLLGVRRARQHSPMFLLERPQSPEAEALRGLHTSVRFSRRGRPPQVLLIVSPYPGEGKTTLACNLAISLAQHGRTCVVDLDLLKEGVAPAFAMTATHGLTEVLTGTAKIEDVTLQVRNVPNLSIIPAGPAVADPGALVASIAIPQLIETLRQTYEFVVIDSPPIVPFVAGRAVAPLADGVVLVGRAGSTKREGMVRAIELLQEVHSAPIVDIVLNAAEHPTVDYRYYRSYSTSA